MAVKKWSKVAVAVQSALAAAKTISAITKASPGNATSTAHGFANGDYVLLSIQGMYQLDGVVARVANVTANNFDLEGIDTTLFDTFTSGTAQAITFGTNITNAASISASGGDFSFIDTTTIHVNNKTQIPGLPNPATFTFDCFWDPSDAAFTPLKKASDNQTTLAIRLTFADGTKAVFTGYVGFSGLPTGNAQDVVKTQAVITMFGKPTYYTT